MAVPIITLCLDTETAEIERENREEKERRKREYTTRPETVGLLAGSDDVIKTVGRAISMAERMDGRVNI